MAGLEGQIIGGCRILRRLGSGGMGEVYLAEQIGLNRQVAIKLVRPEGVVIPGKLSPAERFAREAQAIAAMEHPHILPIYNYGEQDGLAYMVMPYVPNGSLQEALTPGHPSFRFRLPLSLDLTGMILDQAAQALQHAHDRGLLHRDVKPANFLLRASTDGRLHLLLADFGVAKFAAGAASSGVYAGTAIYSAPEQIQNQAVPASDQYGLAVMVYLLLTGQPPFSGGVMEVMVHHLEKPPPSMRAFNPAIPAAVEQVVLRALAKKPEDRWPSVAAFAAVFRAAQSAQAAPAQGSSLSTPAVAASTPTPAQPAATAQQQVLPVQPLPGQAAAAPLPPAPVPISAPTQQAQIHPVQPFPEAPQPPTAVGSPFARESFAGAGLGPPPILPSSGGAPRPRRTGVAILIAVVAVIVLVALAFAFLGGGHALTTNNPPSGTATSGTTGVGTSPPGGTSGQHILNLQTGLAVNGDTASCQVTIAQPTNTFSAHGDAIYVVFSAKQSEALAVAALFNSQNKVVRRPIVRGASLTCAGQGNYAVIILLQTGGPSLAPGNYGVGVSYVTDPNTDPNHIPPPEAIQPITITA